MLGEAEHIACRTVLTNTKVETGVGGGEDLEDRSVCAVTPDIASDVDVYVAPCRSRRLVEPVREEYGAARDVPCEVSVDRGACDLPAGSKSKDFG